MNKVIVYVKHDRHTDDVIRVYKYSVEAEEKVKKLCQNDWGDTAHEVEYQGDYGFGFNDSYFSYFSIVMLEEIL